MTLNGGWGRMTLGDDSTSSEQLESPDSNIGVSHLGAQRGVQELNLRCAEKLPFDGISGTLNSDMSCGTTLAGNPLAIRLMRTNPVNQTFLNLVPCRFGTYVGALSAPSCGPVFGSPNFCRSRVQPLVQLTVAGAVMYGHSLNLPR
jgi:hypothetical protein